MNAFRSFLSEARRRGLPRAVGAYLVGAFVALQVADLVVEPLGLPPSLMTVAVILAVAGLPLTAALSWTFDISVRGVLREREPDDAASQLDARKRRRLIPSWKVAGLLLALLLLPVGFLALRPSSPAELDDHLLAVLPARVGGADPGVAYLREGVVDLMAAKFGNETGLRALDSRTLLRAWRGAGGGRDDLVPQHAIELARQLGAGRLLVPEVVGSPQHLTLNASLLDSGDGTVLGREQVTGPADSLHVLVDRLVIRLLALEAGEAPDRLPSLTSSLPALQAYLRGRVHYRAGHHDAAVRAFHEALLKDSTFALAALGFEESLGWTFVLRDFQEKARRLAWTYRDGLSTRDRFYLEALLGPGYPNEEGTFAEWVAMTERALDLDPSRPEFWNWHGDVLIHYGRPAGVAGAVEHGREAMARALELDPAFAGPRQHLADLAAAAGDTAAFRSITDGYISQLGGEQSEVSVELGWIRSAILREPPPIDPDSLGTRQEHSPVVQSMFSKVQFIPLDPRPFISAMERLDERTAGSQPFIGYRFILALVGGRPEHARQLLPQLGQSTGDVLRWRALLLLDRLLDDVAPVQLESTAAALRADLDGPRPPGRLSLHELTGLCARGLWEAAAKERIQEPLEDIQELIPSLDAPARPLARACAATIEAVWAEGSNGGRPALRRAEELMRQGPLESELLGPPLNLTLARLHERSGDRAAALDAVLRAGPPYGFPISRQVQLREEGRLSALMGDPEAAVRAYQQYLSLRPEPEAEAAKPDAMVRRELERLLDIR